MKALLYQLDAMSRRLVVEVLDQSQYGSVSVADPQDALNTIRNGSVNVALIDTQKDGLELIRTARCQLRGALIHVRMIALAIADTPGNRQRCAEAGADAVLAIPIRPRELLAVLDQLSVPGDAPSSAVTLPSSSKQAALDTASALERVEGDRTLLEELLRLFVDECHGTLRQIRDAWTSHDARALGRLAHTLKGSAANVGANGVSEAAFALERLGRLGKLETAVQHIADLEREIERLEPELDQFLRETAR